MKNVRIGIDGDNGDTTKEGSATERIVQAVSNVSEQNPDINFLLVGNKEAINDCKIDIPSSISIVNSSAQYSPDTEIRRPVEGSSLYLLVDAIKSSEIAGFFSIGGTDKVGVESLRLDRLMIGKKKVKPTLIAEMPSVKGTFLFTDVGATTQRSNQRSYEKAIENLALEIYYQGLMTTAYAKTCLGIEKPRLGVLCNGTESYKGSDLAIKTVEIFKSAIEEKNLGRLIDFRGRVEPKYATRGNLDILLTDGFAGNLVLKFLEAELELIARSCEEGAYVVKKNFNLDDYNCGMFAGLQGIIGKAHGTSTIKAISKGIERTVGFVKKDVTTKIKETLEQYPV